MSEHHAFGGKGAVELAQAVMTACEKPTDFNFLYSLEEPIKAKIEVSAPIVSQTCPIPPLHTSTLSTVDTASILCLDIRCTHLSKAGFVWTLALRKPRIVEHSHMPAMGVISLLLERHSLVGVMSL